MLKERALLHHHSKIDEALLELMEGKDERAFIRKLLTVFSPERIVACARAASAEFHSDYSVLRSRCERSAADADTQSASTSSIR